MLSDETLGWKISFIDMPQEASQMFTPKKSTNGSSGKSSNESKRSFVKIEQQQKLKQQPSCGDSGGSKKDEDTEDMIRSVLLQHSFTTTGNGDLGSH